MEYVMFSFAYKGSEYCDYALQWQSHFPFTRLTGPKIIDTPLMFILPLAYETYATKQVGRGY